jgi:hypothetical protein
MGNLTPSVAARQANCLSIPARTSAAASNWAFSSGRRSHRAYTAW